MSSAQRKRRENERRLILQRQRARREMEISVTNNNSNMGNGGVCLEVDNNDMTILPKGMDLPPSYDELNICNKDGNLGASTLTITTDLGCSNPNLIAAAALNEPPPDYQGTIDIVEAPTTATTISTTTVVSVAPRI
ncbi:PREDICTED: uncharacterized protein LOC108616597 isoform X1 [Drosophila arizonae]|uniref:Uncharacterized protein LOC108616597 isoform X1 n=1 Tax=Drosophila arizonae TaxID=7263 RepID=A0ABM1PJL2_DROAR|nr:PREDICTED: uncharacterized protein LOC108616597 isoform X1 [Drosophila arizonae]